MSADPVALFTHVEWFKKKLILIWILSWKKSTHSKLSNYPRNRVFSSKCTASVQSQNTFWPQYTHALSNFVENPYSIITCKKIAGLDEVWHLFKLKHYYCRRKVLFIRRRTSVSSFCIGLVITKLQASREKTMYGKLPIVGMVLLVSIEANRLGYFKVCNKYHREIIIPTPRGKVDVV